jgi:hypothetical protein
MPADRPADRFGSAAVEGAPDSSGATFRRRRRLAITPWVVAVAVVAAILARSQPAVVAVVAIVTACWVVSALVRARETVTVTPDRITLTTVLGARTLERAAVTGARYYPVYAQGRTLFVGVLQLRAADGTRFWVSRYGWEPDGGQLFGTLSTWLRGTGAEVERGTWEVLDRGRR